MTGKIEANIHLTEKQKIMYKNKIKYLTSKKAAQELRHFPSMIPARKSIFYKPLSEIYRLILMYYYFYLEGADGEILDYWIKDKELATRTIKWIKKHNVLKKKVPFFLHIQIMGPHTPYSPQLPYLLPFFDSDYKGRPKTSPPTQHTPPSVPAPELPKPQLSNLIANYDNSIRITDANLQEIIDFLKKEKNLENTIIIFVSDHGEAFYEHFIYGHMNSLHRELINVPLFFYWKNKINPIKISRPASIVDIFPSLIALSGFENDLKDIDYFQGENLFKNDLKPKFGPRKNFEIHLATIVGGAWKMKRATPEPFGYHTGIITEKDKLIREDEEIGKRYFYYKNSDIKEERLAINPDDENLPERVKKLLKSLPKGPKN
jgi:arylsulfatase A-like enzyme